MPHPGQSKVGTQSVNTNNTRQRYALPSTGKGDSLRYTCTVLFLQRLLRLLTWVAPYPSQKLIWEEKKGKKRRK